MNLIKYFFEEKHTQKKKEKKNLILKIFETLSLQSKKDTIFLITNFCTVVCLK